MRVIPEPLTGEGRIDVRRPAAAIARNLPAIAAISLSFAAMAYVFSHSMTRTYSATATIASQSVGQEDSVDIDTAQRQLAVATSMATSPSVLAGTALRTGATEPDVREALTARLDPGTGVIDITADAGSPARAAQIADAAASEFLVQRAAGIRDGLTATATSLGDEIDRLADQGERAEEDVRVLRERVADIRVQQALAGTDLGLLRAAVPPTSASSPRPALSAFLALLASAIVAAFVVVARDALRKPVTSVRELESLVRAPAIAVMREGRRGRRVDADDAALRLAFESWTGPGRRLVVVSAAGTAANAATVVERLGRALARAGHDTLVIDADLERPSLHRRFRLPAGPGVLRLLGRRGGVSAAALRRAARPVQQDLPGRLALLPAGEAEDGRDQLLTVKNLTKLAEAARETEADYILVRVPPLADAPHAIVLARRADTLVLAVEPREVGSDGAIALGQLARSLGPDVGMIVLDRPAGASRREPPAVPPVAEPAAPLSSARGKAPAKVPAGSSPVRHSRQRARTG
jgi:Mrp family chromosome partitioning ATPase